MDNYDLLLGTNLTAALELFDIMCDVFVAFKNVEILTAEGRGLAAVVVTVEFGASRVAGGDELLVDGGCGTLFNFELAFFKIKSLWTFSIKSEVLLL